MRELHRGHLLSITSDGLLALDVLSILGWDANLFLHEAQDLLFPDTSDLSSKSLNGRSSLHFGHSLSSPFCRPSTAEWILSIAGLCLAPFASTSKRRSFKVCTGLLPTLNRLI